MLNRRARGWRLASCLVLGCALGGVATMVAPRQAWALDPVAERAALQRHATIAARASAALAAQAARAAPTGLSPLQRQKYAEQTSLFTAKATAIGDLGRSMNALLANPAATAEQMAAMNMQFLALQEATQMEARALAPSSTAAQTRHDTAMAAFRP